jgi:hypothetical protein
VATLDIFLPDDLADEVRALGLRASGVCQDALRVELQRSEVTQTTGMGEIVVETGPEVMEGFIGRWLVQPDRTTSTSETPGADPEEFWGVAQTKRGRIAVYVAHAGGSRPPQLLDYDDIGDAQRDGLPLDIVRRAKAELGHIIWRDI